MQHPEMPPTLPPEVLSNIAYQVFNHTRHLRTLHSLLCSSKLLFRETAAVLYYDPFKAASLAMGTIENPTIDYLSLVVSDKLRPTNFFNHRFIYFYNHEYIKFYDHLWTSHRLIQEAGFKGSRLEVYEFNLQLQDSLARIIYGCGDRLSEFKGNLHASNKHEQLHQSQLLATEVSALESFHLNCRPFYSLRHLTLHDTDPNIVEDTMYAFGPTLEHVNLELRRGLKVQPYGASWNLPKLRSFKIFSYRSGFILHANALDHIPNLNNLSLQSLVHHEYTFELPDAFTDLLEDHLKPWTNLQQLTKLTLAGVSSVAFDPSSLQWMPNLESLTVSGPVASHKFIYTIPSAVDNPTTKMAHQRSTPFPNSHLWTWDWQMPSLRVLDLQGDVAARFRFQWLEYCPQLRVLSLDINGTFRRLDLSDFVAASTGLDIKGRESSSEYSPFPRQSLSSTLEEIYLKNGDKCQWLLSPESLEALLGACGPQLTVFHCYTSDPVILQHLSTLSRTMFPGLKRIDLDAAVDRKTRYLSGLRFIGRSPHRTRPSAEQYIRCLQHFAPRRYRDCQLWVFGITMYVYADDIQESTES
ncbi:hypothetical protein BGZ73_008442 [Actinomortierella ambigua]|nr:hypothetical protein BGZ73_008442 [Actinomortierella ambigua]